MIPRAYLTAWRQAVPWADDGQVEQDLVLSRALIEVFSDSSLRGDLILRGGTALQKLVLTPPARYSEDIDLVQRQAVPIGPTLDRVRQILRPWLGEARFRHGAGGTTLVYRFDSETMPARPLRLKVEINTREQFTVLDVEERELRVENSWFGGVAKISCYAVDELLGTKLRALYQRRKGRDLFDLWLALERGLADPARVVHCCCRYLERDGFRVERAAFAANLASKALHPGFRDDIRPLLAAGVNYDVDAAVRVVDRELIALLPGRSQL